MSLGGGVRGKAGVGVHKGPPLKYAEKMGSWEYCNKRSKMTLLV